LETSQNLSYDYSSYYSNEYLNKLNYYLIELGGGYKIVKDPVLIKNNINLYIPILSKENDKKYILQIVQSVIFLLNSNISLFSNIDYNLISKNSYYTEDYSVNFGISYLVSDNSEIKLGFQSKYSNSTWTPGVIISYEKVFWKK